MILIIGPVLTLINKKKDDFFDFPSNAACTPKFILFLLFQHNINKSILTILYLQILIIISDINARDKRFKQNIM